jgi:thioester reductase-like protein
MKRDINPDAIAVIGLGIDLPGARDADQLWQILNTSDSVIRHFSRDEMIAHGVSQAEIDSPGYVPAKSVLEDTFGFDPGFFRMSEREASMTDPAHRLFLRTVWRAFENAGYIPGGDLGSVSVFGGVAESTYLLTHLLGQPGLLEAAGKTQAKIACDKDFLTTRASFKLDLRGPSVAVQSSCSTGLVAVHLACQSLLSRESDLAVAGAASVNFPLCAGYRYRKDSIYSPDGKCRPFDAGANGTVFGDGVAAVLLKRYEDAVRDSDHIWALVDATAINNDGGEKAGYAAPSVDGQIRVIEEALALAGVTPDQIDMIEAHGTGTQLGDPIELKALTSVLGSRDIAREGPIDLGSIKAKLGHLNTCAGMAGFIAACLSVHHGQRPGTLNFQATNPLSPAPDGLFRITSAPQKMKPGKAGSKDRLVAGVSSFGIGGTNAHAIVSGFVLQDRAPAEAVTIVPVSAQSSDALDWQIKAVYARLDAGDLRRDDLALTARQGRLSLPHLAILILSDQHRFLCKQDDGVKPGPGVMVEIGDTSGWQAQDIIAFCACLGCPVSTPASAGVQAIAADLCSILQDAFDTDATSETLRVFGGPGSLFPLPETDPETAAMTFARTLAKMAAQGVRVDWMRLQPLPAARRAPIPGYLFDDVQCLVPAASVLNRDPETKPASTEQKGAAASLVDHLSHLFTEVLGVNDVRPEDDFVDLGGDSLSALDLSEAIKRDLSLEVSVSDILAMATPAVLARKLASSTTSQAKGDLAQTEAVEADIMLSDMAFAPQFGNGMTAQAANACVFITGATGFLGSRVAEEILRSTDRHLACLVRDAELSSQDRLINVLTGLGLPQSLVKDRVRVINGDLRKPNLGMSEADQDFVRRNADTIIHIGSDVNWVLDYAHLRSANVSSTRAIADLARSGVCRKLTYVSSVAVYDGPHWPNQMVYQETMRLRDLEGLYTGYGKTKAVSESIMLDCADERLKVSVLRPAYITGDSRDGTYNQSDFVYSVIHAMAQLGKAPDSPYRLSATPVDHVAQALWAVTKTSDAPSGTLHLLNPNSIYLTDIATRMISLGFPVKKVPTVDFFEALQDAAQERKIDAIAPFVGFFVPPDPSYAWVSADGRTGFGKAYCGQRLFELIGKHPIFVPLTDEYLALSLQTALTSRTLPRSVIARPEGRTATAGAQE